MRNIVAKPADMTGSLKLINRQRYKTVNSILFKQIILHVLEKRLKLQDYDLTVQLLTAAKMAELNQTSLNHKGPTDVITFGYSTLPQVEALAGELFVCVEVAEDQSRTFGTTWQSELVRYVVHGILHLLGYDDLEPIARRKMKAAESRLVRTLEAEFDLRNIG